MPTLDRLTVFNTQVLETDNGFCASYIPGELGITGTVFSDDRLDGFCKILAKSGEMQIKYPSTNPAGFLLVFQNKSEVGL